MTGRFWADLALGARLAVAGGGRTRLRTALTAAGVGLGVVLLLLAASVPNLAAGHEDRTSARDHLRFEGKVEPGPGTLVAASADTQFRDASIRGVLLDPDGPDAPAPAGVRSLPAPGTMYVSPALADLLRSPDGARLLAPRLPYEVAGTIAGAGLAGPHELTYYAGRDGLEAGRGTALRIDRFGSQYPQDGLDPYLVVLVVVIVVVLLVPVAIFLAAAVRFGGEQRDRRLAALRLVGADAWMARRIAAGEALVGALLGLLVGGALFALARPLAERVDLFDVGVFAADIRPSALLLAIVCAAVPAVAVGASLIALRSVTIDPLGVSKRARPPRRRLLWRLALPLAGALALLPMLGVDVSEGEEFSPLLTAGGVTLLLVGVAALLPWAVETAVHRMDGGGVAWQLATRRLQLDSGTSARVVSGIAVAVAGAIALQTLFDGVEDRYATTTGERPGVASVGAAGTTAARLERALRATDGVGAVVAYTDFGLKTERRRFGRVTVASCATVRVVLEVSRCADGEAFATGSQVRPGEPARLAGRDWRVPDDLRAAEPRGGPLGAGVRGFIATPATVAGLGLRGFPFAEAAYDASQPDAIERLRNAVASASVSASVDDYNAVTTERELVLVRTGLFAGAGVVLLLIAASMLVSALEQLYERRRLLASLVAFGTPQATLRRSVMLQTAVPVGLGLALAVVTGIALGALLLQLVNAPLRVDVPIVLAMTAIGAAIVPLVTALSLPALRRLARPEGLRFE